MADTPGGKKAWTEIEKIAYLVLLLDTEGKVDEKIRKTPTPAGRTVVSCSRMFTRLKEKHKADMEKIKAGQDLNAAPTSGGDDAEDTPSKKPKAAGGRKRKTKAVDDNANDDSPVKKKAGGRKTNDAALLIKQEMIEEQEDLDNSI